MKVKELTVEYGNRTIIENLSMQAEFGEIIGLVAPNGTGKTTFFNAISGLIPRKNGNISLNKIDYNSRSATYLKELFFLESSKNLYDYLTPKEHLEYVKAAWKSNSDIEHIFEQLKMKEYQNRTIKKLSLGMKQHVLLAMYLASDATILLLDEPFNGLDPTSVSLFIMCLKEIVSKDKIVILSSHDLYNVEHTCTRILFMKNKKLVENDQRNLSLREQYDNLYLRGEKRNVKIETIKILKEKSLWFVFVSFILMLIYPLLAQPQQLSFKEMQYENRIKNNEQAKEKMKNEPAAKETLNEIEDESEQLRKAINAIKIGDEWALLEAEKKLEESNLNAMLKGTLYSIPIIEQQKRVKELQYLSENRIKQVDSSEVAKMPALNYLGFLLSMDFPYTLLLIIPSLMIIALATLEKRKNTVSLWNGLPLKLWEKYSIKISSILFTVGLVSYLSIFLSAISAFFKNGLGNPDYPVAIIEKGQSVTIISLSNYLSRSLIMFGMLLLALTVFSFLLSLFTGNLIVHSLLIVGVVLSSGFSMLSNKFFFTAYMNFPKIINGGNGYEPMDEIGLTFDFSLKMIVVYVLISLIVSAIVLRNRKGLF
ncbi:ABC-2 type transport system ATP-binding protein [Enterococcus sp. DIV0185]